MPKNIFIKIVDLETQGLLHATDCVASIDANSKDMQHSP